MLDCYTDVGRTRSQATGSTAATRPSSTGSRCSYQPFPCQDPTYRSQPHLCRECTTYLWDNAVSQPGCAATAAAVTTGPAAGFLPGERVYTLDGDFTTRSVTVAPAAAASLGGASTGGSGGGGAPADLLVGRELCEGKAAAPVHCRLVDGLCCSPGRPRSIGSATETVAAGTGTGCAESDADTGRMCYGLPAALPPKPIGFKSGPDLALSIDSSARIAT